MITVKVKPLSANRAFQGRRFKTPEYEEYERELGYLLPKSLPKPLPKKMELHYVFGLSSKNSDLGNCEKQCTDILSKHYGFNDRHIYRIVMERADVKKGEEFISFDITEANTFMIRLDSLRTKP